ncbi:thioredoxin [Paenibacillus alginolyticus]|uniref:Thioredoxin n=1 Tax=Paenibacillus alginolyticus TaxID=59839 RepID=A0ABT4GA27_9BACL|nr:thioredoxin [Paenibacillus alginolyticus]MCY9692958.1 thioredoxin [Paenibacillus alginolyticus]MEC0144630.1 thioredoxin [Paenibacillus alginolyticus]
MVIDIKDQMFQDTIGQEGLVIIEFWAPWCSYCKLLAPILEELDHQYGDTVKIAKINVETESVVSTELNVQSLPALFFYKNGSVVGTVTGFVPKNTLEEAINQLI